MALMAGPDGVHQPGDVLDLPIAEADRLIAARAAVEVVRPAGKGCANKRPTSRSLFTPDELEHGVTLDRWAMTRCPDAFALARRGRVVLVLGEDASNDPERERYWAAVHELRGALQADLDAGRYDLGVPPETAVDTAKAVSLDALADVLDHIAWHHKLPHGYYGSDPVNLRLYQPGRFTAATPAAAPKASVPQAASDSTAPSTPAEAGQPAPIERKEKKLASRGGPRPGHAEKVRLRGKAIAWFKELAAVGRKEKAKPLYLKEAVSKFPGLTQTQAGIAWGEALKDYPEWTTAGRRPNKNKK